MSDTLKRAVFILGIIAVLAAIGFVLLLFFSRTPASPPVSAPESSPLPNTGTSVSVTGSLPQSPASNLPASQGQRIFKIAGGPVTGATLLELSQPTTTVARFITSQDGHIYDLPLDTPGASPRLISNTTIPGIARAVWTQGGLGVIVQYLDSGVVKSAYLSLGTPTSTPSAGAIRFLPDDIADIASSPDGGSIAYLLRNAAGGVSGFIAKSDGTLAKKAFSLPLRDVVLAWPAPGTILAYSKSASGVPGIAFSINAKTGAQTPLLYGQGFTALADPSFSYLMYRTDSGLEQSAFIENLAQGTAVPLALSPLAAPLPEQCAWFPQGTSTPVLYCAAGQNFPPSYLDLWHEGQASATTVLIKLTSNGALTFIAGPGTRDGGQSADMTDLVVSPDGRYLSYIAKDDATLWGVRLQSN